MINFELSEEHIALQQTVREFVQGEVAPYIKEWDEKSHFERSVFDKMAELGLMGVCIPEQYGGAGFDYISLGIVCEELEAMDTFLRVAMSVHVGLNSLSVYSWGTEEQKQKYLVPQAKGEKLATFGLDRAERRFGRCRHALLRPARWRRLDSQWRKDVDMPGRCGRPFPVFLLD